MSARGRAPVAALGLIVLILGAAAVAGAAPAPPAPDTRITAKPSSPRFDRSARFRFAAPGAPDATFECRLDGAAWRACASPLRTRLTRGSHRFEVRAASAAGAADPSPAVAAVRVVPRRVVFGESVEGRRLVAVRSGDPGARRAGLLIGEIHGDEPEGREVVSRLRRLGDGRIGEAELWTVKTVNPDGARRDTRKNAHGVDLNRNFSVGWSGAEPPSSGYYAGPRPFSEPESRAVARLARRIDPRVTIYFHQPWGAVLVPCDGRAPVQERYSRISRLGTSCRGAGLPGTAIGWQRKKLGRTPFVVELAAGELRAGAARRHARAALAVIRGPGGRR